jgi:acetate kinase
MRGRICRKLAWLGLKLDESANASNASVINPTDSKVRLRTIPTDEERMMALHTLATIGPAGP